MDVTEREVRQVAALARLALEDDALPAVAADLRGILAHMEQLRAFAEADAASAAPPAPAPMPWREDVPVLQGNGAVAVDAIAPSVQDGFFLVPQVVSHGPGHEPAGGGA